MSNTIFKETTITYTKADIEKLANLYNLNGRSIGNTLSVALGLDLFQEAEERAVVIVKCLEMIDSVLRGLPLDESHGALGDLCKSCVADAGPINLQSMSFKTKEYKMDEMKIDPESMIRDLLMCMDLTISGAIMHSREDGYMVSTIRMFPGWKKEAPESDHGHVLFTISREKIKP